MVTTTAQAAATDIVQDFGDNADVTEEDVETEIETLASEWKIPIAEAKRNVRNDLLDKHGANDDDEEVESKPDEFNPSPVDSINSSNLTEFKDYLVRIVDLWEPRDNRINQVGLVGDDSGVVKFTTWVNDDLPEVEEGEIYRIKKVIAEEYQGRFAIKFNNSSEMVKVEDADVDVGRSNDDTKIEGVLVEVRNGSGLIKRCPKDDCNRVVRNGRCAVHGEVEGEFDLRIKAVVDDGFEAHDVIFNEESTTELTDITLEEAKEMAMDALDTSVVEDEIADEFIGSYIGVEGPKLGRNILANDFEVLTGPNEEMLESLAETFNSEDTPSTPSGPEAAV